MRLRRVLTILTIVGIAGTLIATVAAVELAYAPLGLHHENGNAAQTGHEQNPGDYLVHIFGIVFWALVDAIERHHDLVIALGTIAIAAFTFTLWRSTDRLWDSSREHAGHMEGSAKAAEKAAEAASEANRLARDNFTVNVRPWLAVIDIRAAGPIDYDGVGCTIGLFISVKNVGRSPAMNISISSRIFPRVVHPNEVAEIKERLGNNAMPFRWGEVLFPDQPPIALQLRQRMEQDQMKLGPDVVECILNPLVIGCITYRFAVGAPDVHHTWFGVVIGRGPVPDGVSPGQIDFYLNQPSPLVPKEQIAIGRYTVGDWTPD